MPQKRREIKAVDLFKNLKKGHKNISNPKKGWFATEFAKTLAEYNIKSNIQSIVNNPNFTSKQILEYTKGLILENAGIKHVFNIDKLSEIDKNKVFKFVLTTILYDLKKEGNLSRNPFLEELKIKRKEKKTKIRLWWRIKYWFIWNRIKRLWYKNNNSWF